MKPFRKSLVLTFMAACTILPVAGQEGWPQALLEPQEPPPATPRAPKAPTAPPPVAGQRAMEIAKLERMAGSGNYDQCKRIVERREYEEAVTCFGRVISNKNTTHADGSYYWKAYSLNRLGSGMKLWHRSPN